MFVIDKVIQQIAIQRGGEDCDPSAALAEIDFRSIVNDSSDSDRVRGAEEKLRKQVEKSRRLEKDLIVVKTEMDKNKGMRLIIK
jgi:sialic acid synthase SpsE